MKQLLQDLRTGNVELAEVPRPLVRAGHLLIATEKSLISTGTERMLVDFGRAGWIDKARQQPDKVRQERLEVFCGGRILVLDNSRRLTGYGWKGFRGDRLWRQDKGHAAEVAAFVSAVENGGPPPIPFEEIVEVTRVTIDVARMLKDGKSRS